VFSSGGKPNTLMDIELNCTIVSHLQQKALAVFLVFDVRALHHLENLQWLFSKCAEYLFSVGLRHLRSLHKAAEARRLNF
jgi:hypothetical protein